MNLRELLARLLASRKGGPDVGAGFGRSSYLPSGPRKPVPGVSTGTGDPLMQQAFSSSRFAAGPEDPFTAGAAESLASPLATARGDLDGALPSADAGGFNPFSPPTDAANPPAPGPFGPPTPPQHMSVTAPGVTQYFSGDADAPSFDEPPMGDIAGQLEAFTGGVAPPNEAEMMQHSRAMHDLIADILIRNAHGYQLKR